MLTNALICRKVSLQSSDAVADRILNHIGNIFKDLKMNPDDLPENRKHYREIISTWMESEHLKHVTLQFWNPCDYSKPMNRIVYSLDYGYNLDSDDTFWLSMIRIREQIRRTGLNPKFIQWNLVLSKRFGGKMFKTAWESDSDPFTVIDEKQLGGFELDERHSEILQHFIFQGCAAEKFTFKSRVISKIKGFLGIPKKF